MSKIKFTKRHTSFIILLISIILSVLLYPIMQNPIALQKVIDQAGLWGIFLNIFILALQTLFPIVPFALLAGINAILFGWIPGILISLAGSMAGASIGFFLARNLGHEWVEKRLVKWPKLYDYFQLSKGTAFFTVLSARLIPFLPSAAINYFAGLSKMNFYAFFGASLIGKIPMITWETVVGHDFWHFTSRPWHFLLVLSVGIFLWSIIAMIYYANKKAKKTSSL